MSAPISNRAEAEEAPPLPAYRVHRKHYWMHAASGCVVFGLGILADIAVQEVRYRWPHKVRWINNEVSDGHRLNWKKDAAFWTTNTIFGVDLGFADDGTVYWKATRK